MKVLLIDDEKMERDGLKFLFRNLGFDYDFTEAVNGQDGLEKLESEDFDIAITDIKMPVMDGIKFLLKAKEKKPKVKYIIYSGYSDFEYAKEAIALNVIDYILKPVEDEEFIRVITRTIRLIEEENYEKRKQEIYNALKGCEVDIHTHIKDGMAIIFYMEKPILDKYYEQFDQLLHSIFSQVDLFIENEQEGSFIVWENEKELRKKLEVITQKMNQMTESGCQMYVTPVFSNLEELKNVFSEGKKIMNKSFFAKKNAIISTLDDKNEICPVEFEDINMSYEMGQISSYEALMLLMKAISNQHVFSNVYTKYIIVKQIEKISNNITPEIIEEVLLSRDMEELQKAVNKILEKAPQVQEDAIIRKIKEYIKDNYMNNISIDDIAKHVYLTANYLCGLFKGETGKTIIKYLTEYRMKVAANLITSTFMKLSDVSKRVGYNNPSYFNMIFKNYYGMTPSAYREGKRNEN